MQTLLSSSPASRQAVRVRQASSKLSVSRVSPFLPASNAVTARPAFHCGCSTPGFGRSQLSHLRPRTHVCAGDDSDKQVQYSTEFGYSRKDVVLIGVGLLGLGYGLYYGLQAAGVEAAQAGLYTQLVVVLLLSVGWVSTYLFRVATKQMTYTQQLQAYEQAVMEARLKEMTEEEVEKLMTNIEAEKQKFADKQQK